MNQQLERMMCPKELGADEGFIYKICAKTYLMDKILRPYKMVRFRFLI